jgi:hypothetical protein
MLVSSVWFVVALRLGLSVTWNDDSIRGARFAMSFQGLLLSSLMRVSKGCLWAAGGVYDPSMSVPLLIPCSV